MTRAFAVRCSLAAVGGAVVLVVAGSMIRHQVDEARKARCADHLKQMGQAFQMYHDAHGHFPPAAVVGKDGRPLLSWRVALLPHLGYRGLYERFHLDEPWDGPHNRTLLREMPPIFACPGQPRRGGMTVYRVVVGPETSLNSVGTMFEEARGIEIREVLDGTSNTLMVAETGTPVPWTKPDDLRFDVDGPLPKFGSRHPGGFHALLADGIARFINHTIEPRVLRALLTRDGGEVVSA
jgi:hypothetical protein